MSSLHIAFAVAAAVLVFWIVGAYNRLVSLRGEVAKTFAPVEIQLRQRNALIERWLGTLRPWLDQALQSIDAVAAACGQLAAAFDVLCRRPLLAAPAATVRLAESTLVDARRRLQADVTAALARHEAEGTAPASNQAQQPSVDPQAAVDLALAAEALSSADAALNFARIQFNETSENYNAARRQFPTWLVAALFGFRPAGSL